ncbi:MAG: S1 RNA-binding domain-containing protein [Eubacterium sp.]|nr:S1 RNA-binding domain-containing protein [Eubacterium sp.]
MSEENMTMDDLSKAVDESFDTFKDEGAANWEQINQYLTEKTVLTVTVEEVVNKGVVTHLEGIRGFIPASHLALTHVDDLNTYAGKEIQVQVLEADEAKNRLLLSCRAVLRAKADEERRARIEAMEIGTVLEGKVESLQPYGAFIDLGDRISGLVHVSQISHKRVNDPSDVLSINDVVKVKVINVKDGKLSLSIKALQERPEGADRPQRERRERREDEGAMPKDYKLPKSEELTTSFGDLLKGIKLD